MGETLRQAARREVREECGIEIALGDVVDAVDIIFRDDTGRAQYHYVVIDFAAEYVNADLRAASDVLEARWVPIGELSAFPLPEPTRAVIRKAISHEITQNHAE